MSVRGVPPPPFTDKIFGKKGVADLGGTPLLPFMDISPKIFVQKGLKIVFLAQKTLDYGPKKGYGFGGYPPPPLYGFSFGKKGVTDLGGNSPFTDKICKVVFDTFSYGDIKTFLLV